jgi:hypothetical protein
MSDLKYGMDTKLRVAAAVANSGSKAEILTATYHGKDSDGKEVHRVMFSEDDIFDTGFVYVRTENSKLIGEF